VQERIATLTTALESPAVEIFGQTSNRVRPSKVGSIGSVGLGLGLGLSMYAGQSVTEEEC